METGCAYGMDLTTVLWKDTKNVRLFNVCWDPTVSKIESRRTDTNNASLRQKENVNYRQIIRDYNSQMGGFDFMDSHMGRSRLRIKTTNAMTRIFYHPLDMAVTNAFILYRRSNAEDAAKTDSEEEASGAKDRRLFQFR